MMKHVGYKVVCELSQDFCIGETTRPLHFRIEEHMSFTKPSELSIKIRFHVIALNITREIHNRVYNSPFCKNLIDLVERKIREAIVVKERTPPINIRVEMRSVLRLITI